MQLVCSLNQMGASMHRLISSAVLAFALALVACDGAQLPVAPDGSAGLTLRIPDTAGTKVIMYMPDDDNVSCWGGSDGYWICFHQNDDYGSPWSNPIVNYCSLYPETCLFVPYGGGGGVANPVFPLDPVANSDEGFGEDSMPTSCPSTVQAIKLAYPLETHQPSRAWCLSASLNDVAVYKTRVQSALGRLRALGGICSDLADLGDTLVANGRVRVFAHNTVREGLMGTVGYVGGALPAAGGPLSKFSFLTLNERLTKFAFDLDRPDAGSGLTMDVLLAHELSHLLGDEHEEVVDGLWRTNMELACM